MRTYIEHANITVIDAEHTIKLLLAAAPDWSIRGEGRMDDWFGKAVRWYHVGDEQTYITIQNGGDTNAKGWTEHWSGVKHIGIVVESLDDVITRLSNSGYQLDHMGGNHPHRRSVYYVDKHNLQFEFVEYLSEEPALKNDYNLG
ncbi:VOC family protein [Vibrio hannami]|uniref:VOC family protein n=1 Tax=Vibrio hannami TaxID=2717094 RepID=UPI00240EFD5A|nr:VOC family protein [Vibrio hannami]MDG3085812.1 VOC family protein [Vibrio hannami]